MCGLLTVQEVVGASNLHIVQGSTVFCFLQLGKTPLNLRGMFFFIIPCETQFGAVFMLSHVINSCPFSFWVCDTDR